ncbi:Hypothetical protein SMAX5B_005127, partial [Scophthalmus maximus]
NTSKAQSRGQKADVFSGIVAGRDGRGQQAEVFTGFQAKRGNQGQRQGRNQGGDNTGKSGAEPESKPGDPSVGKCWKV